MWWPFSRNSTRRNEKYINKVSRDPSCANWSPDYLVQSKKEKGSHELDSSQKAEWRRWNKKDSDEHKRKEDNPNRGNISEKGGSEEEKSLSKPGSRLRRRWNIMLTKSRWWDLKCKIEFGKRGVSRNINVSEDHPLNGLSHPSHPHCTSLQVYLQFLSEFRVVVLDGSKIQNILSTCCLSACRDSDIQGNSSSS